MVQQIKSRSQRRMEKKQAVMLVVLLFGISLVSFFLGILVGRSSSPPAQPPQDIVSTPLPVAPPAPVVAPPPEPPPPPVATPEPEPVAKREPLTFYEALPKGENPPLGSGINLPPAVKPAAKAEAPPETASSTPPTPSTTPAASTTPAPAVVPAPSVAAPAPKVVAHGAYVVQAASFRKLADAVTLRDRLTKKGHAAVIQTADLGGKGIWYRVVVGPYAGSGDAAQAAARLNGEEKLSGMVRKQ